MPDAWTFGGHFQNLSTFWWLTVQAQLVMVLYAPGVFFFVFLLNRGNITTYFWHIEFIVFDISGYLIIKHTSAPSYPWGKRTPTRHCSFYHSTATCQHTRAVLVRWDTRGIRNATSWYPWDWLWIIKSDWNRWDWWNLVSYLTLLLWLPMRSLIGQRERPRPTPCPPTAKDTW